MYGKRFNSFRVFRVITALLMVAALISSTVGTALAGTVGNAAGFEDDDSNLEVNSTFDWNGFAPTTWMGTAPYRQSDADVSGWKFKGIEDAQATPPSPEASSRTTTVRR